MLQTLHFGDQLKLPAHQFAIRPVSQQIEKHYIHPQGIFPSLSHSRLVDLLCGHGPSLPLLIDRVGEEACCDDANDHNVTCMFGQLSFITRGVSS